jgi:uncharacterized damage-inducible protein DinB
LEPELEPKPKPEPALSFDPSPLDPPPTRDETELLLGFLRRKRADVLRTTEDLTEEQARWTPPGRLLPIIGIVNHLTQVEWRWIDGLYLRDEVSRSEAEFHVGDDRTLPDVVDAYRARQARTESIVRSAPDLDVACTGGPDQPAPSDLDLRWTLVHLIEETAHHAGHADATRELLDGSTESTR